MQLCASAIFDNGLRKQTKKKSEENPYSTCFYVFVLRVLSGDEYLMLREREAAKPVTEPGSRNSHVLKCGSVIVANHELLGAIDPLVAGEGRYLMYTVTRDV